MSAPSVWEIAVKPAIGRGDIPVSGDEAFGWFRRAGYRRLPVTPEHASATERLPPHQADPFDRLLVDSNCGTRLQRH